VQAFLSALMKAATPVHMHHDAVAPVCAALSVYQHFNLITPRESCALLRHLCLYVHSAFDSLQTSELPGGAAKSARPRKVATDSSGPSSPGSPRLDPQFASPGTSHCKTLPACTPAMYVLSYYFGVSSWQAADVEGPQNGYKGSPCGGYHSAQVCSFQVTSNRCSLREALHRRDCHAS
jgi:hypothetical protein